jgi:hypothetical protein
VASLRAALAAPTAEEALRRYLRFAIDTVTAVDDEEVTRGCLTTKTATDETAMGDAIRAALRGLLDDVQGLLADRLAQPDAAGLALPPAAAARLITTTTRGMVVLERVYRDVAQLEAVADDLLRLMFPRASGEVV